MWLLISIIFLLVSIYSLCIFLLSEGVRRLQHTRSDPPSATARVTLVIPFRNEQQNLPGLVKDLVEQDYPVELLQFLFVDDHSGDRSVTVLEELTRRDSRAACLRLPAGQTGKKAAIGLAVQHARGDWIIQVDADCRMGPRFVSTHMAFRETYPCDLLAGMVTTGRGPGRFRELLERMELMGLAGVGAGSFHRGWPVMCSGANLGYSRQLFLETRTLEPRENLASGDDMFLMIGARKLKKILRYILDPDAVVRTRPAGSWGTLVNQRVRWGGKSIHYRMADIQMLALLVASTNLGVMLCPLCILLFPSGWIWPVLAFTVKSAADLLMLYRISAVTGQRRDLRWFLPVSICFYPFQMIVVTALFFGRSQWKGRQLKEG